MQCILLVVCTLCCIFIHLLQPSDLSRPSKWSLYILSRMPLTFQSRILLPFLYLRLKSADYKTVLQKALISPSTEYENCANWNFRNSNYVYNRVIIVPENDRFPLPIGTFIVLTLVDNLVEYLRRGAYWWKGTAMWNSKYSKPNLSQSHFVHHKSHTQ